MKTNQIKSILLVLNQVAGLPPVTCIQLHKNNHRHNTNKTSTNLVIGETMKYEKYGN